MDSDKIFDEAQEKLTNPQAIVKRELPPVIYTLDDLYQAAQEKRAVHWPPGCPSTFIAAAFVLNMPGSSLYRSLQIGLRLYEPKDKPREKKPDLWQELSSKKKGKTLVEVFKEEEERNANQTNP